MSLILIALKFISRFIPSHVIDFFFCVHIEFKSDLCVNGNELLALCLYVVANYQHYERRKGLLARCPSYRTTGTMFVLPC